MNSAAGFPPMLSCFDWTVDRACEASSPYAVPDGLRYHLIVQRYCHRVSKVMSENASDPAGLPSENGHQLLMSLLEHDLEVLKAQYWDGVSGKSSIVFVPCANSLCTDNVVIDQAYILAAQLHLHSFYWLGPSAIEQRQFGLLKSFATASSVITHLLSLDASIQLLTHSTIVFPRMLFQSAYIIFKVLNSSLSKYVDLDAGEALYHAVVVALRSWQVPVHDASKHPSAILEVISRRRGEHINELYQEPVLIVRGRLSASLTLEGLRRWANHARGTPHVSGMYLVC